MKNVFFIILNAVKKVLFFLWQKIFLYPLKIPVIGLFLLLIIIFSSEYVLSKTRPAFFIRLFNVAVPKAAPEISETDKLLNDLKKLISLPTNESPTVATITDIEKIKDQPFFNKAQNGDKVIIYTANHKAILYRPSEKMIIDVGPINTEQSPTPTPTVSAKKTTPTATPAP